MEISSRQGWGAVVSAVATACSCLHSCSYWAQFQMQCHLISQLQLHVTSSQQLRVQPQMMGFSQAQLQAQLGTTANTTANNGLRQPLQQLRSQLHTPTSQLLTTACNCQFWPILLYLIILMAFFVLFTSLWPTVLLSMFCSGHQHTNLSTEYV